VTLLKRLEQRVKAWQGKSVPELIFPTTITKTQELFRSWSSELLCWCAAEGFISYLKVFDYSSQ
jgi:hypothetical protein